MVSGRFLGPGHTDLPHPSAGPSLELTDLTVSLQADAGCLVHIRSLLSGTEPVGARPKKTEPELGKETATEPSQRTY